MAPEATILIFHITSYGQIVSDTLRFPVSGLSTNNVSARMLSVFFELYCDIEVAMSCVTAFDEYLKPSTS